MNKEERRIQAVIELLTPYYENKELISIENGKCRYNSGNGNHCVFAMACEDPMDLIPYEGSACEPILEERGEYILKEKYIGLFTTHEWLVIQSVHDSRFNRLSIINLEHCFPELKDKFIPEKFWSV